MTDIETDKLTQEQIAILIHDLDHAGRNLPVQAIQLARRHREQIIPELIKVIQRDTLVVRNKQPKNTHGAFFALFLLAEFRATESLPAILDAISLSGDGPFELFGDAIHDVLPRVLLAVAPDTCADIATSLFKNPELNEYVRGAAAHAIGYLAFTGNLTRAEVVRMLQHFLREAIEQEDNNIVTVLVMTMIDLHPWEAAQDIEAAFQRGLVDEWMIDWNTVKECLHDRPLEPSNSYRTPAFIEDTIRELEHWASFQKPKQKPKIWQSEARVSTSGSDVTPRTKQLTRPSPTRVGRNDPCPCGSGKKFKKCCGSR